jgi:hypothetical protein
MLNLTTLKQQFDEMLASFTKKDLQNWLEFAEQRSALEKLQKGETVSITMKPLKTVHLSHVSNISFTGILIKDNTGNNNYPTAA